MTSCGLLDGSRKKSLISKSNILLSTIKTTLNGNKGNKMNFLNKIKNWLSNPEPIPVEPEIDLSSLKVVELREIAKERGMKGYTKHKKAELLQLLKGE
tara:strand:+ start:35 stop:328 length:294 start_codon:yes stop_codon:yes gene_type:complete